jgi:hypothetical protein
MADIKRRERDASAVKAAEALWPQRYMGDLTTAEWERCYAVVDAANDRLAGAVAALRILADHTEWWLHSQEHEPMPHPVDVLEAAVRAPDHGGSDA